MVKDGARWVHEQSQHDGQAKDESYERMVKMRIMHHIMNMYALTTTNNVKMKIATLKKCELMVNIMLNDASLYEKHINMKIVMMEKKQRSQWRCVKAMNHMSEMTKWSKGGRHIRSNLGGTMAEEAEKMQSMDDKDNKMMKTIKDDGKYEQGD